MANFPTLTQGPNIEEYTEEQAFDPVIRSEFESGAHLTRPRFSATKKKWHIIYDNLTAADKSSLDTFQGTTVAYADSFTWANTEDGSNYTVVFGSPIKYKLNPVSPGAPKKTWKAEFDLIEA
jgi:hypothetical protein